MSDYCRNGHDLRIVGRAKQGWCNECKRTCEREYHAEHREERNAKQLRANLSPERVEQLQIADRKRWHETGDRHRDLEKRRAYHSAYSKTRKWRGHRLLKKGEYETRLKNQGGVCAACQRPERVKLRGKIARLCVDHDHESGIVRALLCNNCNRALGMLGEDPNVLFALADYILRFKPVEELESA